MRQLVSDIADVVKALIKRSSQDDVSGLAAELAYRLLLAMFPFFIFVAALGGFIAALFNIDNPAGRLVDQVRGTLPNDAASVLQGQLEDILSSQNSGLLSLGIVTAIWAASGAIKTVMKALNRAYDVPEARPFWRQSLVAVALTLLAGVSLTGAFALLIAGQLYAGDIGDAIGVGDFLTTALNWLRLPLAALMVMVAIAFLYWAAPNKRLPFRWVSPGSVIFIVAWISFTLGFGFYVANFGSYNSTYGTLGGVVVLLIWLYLSSLLMLLGAELNVVLASRAEPEMTPQEPARSEEARQESRSGPR